MSDVKYPHLQYAKDVVDGKYIVGELVRLRCKMSLDDHENPPDEWYFSEKDAQDPIEFLRRCPHVRGSEWTKRDPATGQRAKIEPEAWVVYFIGEVFGWWSRDGLGRRRYNNCGLEVGKKNGKSAIAGGLGLYETVCGDDGGEIYCIATTLDQAKKAWGQARDMAPGMVELNPPGAREIDKPVKITTGNDEIVGKALNSVFKPLPGRPKSLDGINPSFAIIDEAALIETARTFTVLEDSTAARKGSCVMRITTASGLDNTTWMEERDRNIQMLKDGEVSREFYLLYEMDEGDDYDDEDNWYKSNPGLGTIKDMEWMRNEFNKCRASPAKLNDFRIYQLNEYTGTSEAQWLSTQLWDDLDEYDDQDIVKRYAAVDMAQSQDLAAVCFMNILADGRSFLEFKCYAARASLEEVPEKYRDQIKDLYFEAQDEKLLHLAPGNMVDFNQIEDDLHEEYTRMPWTMLGYDDQFRKDIFLRMEDKNIPVVRVSQSAANLSPAAYTCENNLKDKKYLVKDKSKFLRWQFMNATRKDYDDGMVKVKHHPQAYKKMDAILAMIMCERVYDSKVESAGESHFYVGTF